MSTVPREPVSATAVTGSNKSLATVAICTCDATVRCHCQKTRQYPSPLPHCSKQPRHRPALPGELLIICCVCNTKDAGHHIWMPATPLWEHSVIVSDCRPITRDRCMAVHPPPCPCSRLWVAFVSGCGKRCTAPPEDNPLQHVPS